MLVQSKTADGMIKAKTRIGACACSQKYDNVEEE